MKLERLKRRETIIPDIGSDLEGSIEDAIEHLQSLLRLPLFEEYTEVSLFNTGTQLRLEGSRLETDLELKCRQRNFDNERQVRLMQYEKLKKEFETSEKEGGFLV